MKTRIVAIGGGEIGKPGTTIETKAIDLEIIRLTGKKHPKVLLLPTASGDSPLYYSTMQNYYGEKLGCAVDVLNVITTRYPPSEIKEKILSADIIYVGGGNTLRMLKAWRRHGIDKLLSKARERGSVLAGVSAGAICWFKYGNSDSLKFSDSRNPLIKLHGLDFVSTMACPHYDVEKSRRPSLHRMIKEKGGMSIALTNCSAIEILGDNYRILTSSPNARAYKVYRSNGKVIEEELPSDNKYRPLEELLRK